MPPARAPRRTGAHPGRRHALGRSQVGKAPGFGPGIRRFESSRPSQLRCGVGAGGRLKSGDARVLSSVRCLAVSTQRDQSKRPLAVVVLAAGLGTRMKSDVPKVLHEVCGRPMLSYIVDAALSLSPERVVVVTGPEHDAVSAILPVGCERAVQQQRRGTGDAVQAGMEPLDGLRGRRAHPRRRCAAGRRRAAQRSCAGAPRGRYAGHAWPRRCWPSRRTTEGWCAARRAAWTASWRPATPRRRNCASPRSTRASTWWTPLCCAPCCPACAGQRAGRAVPHRCRAARHRRRRRGGRLRGARSAGHGGHQLARRAGRRQRRHAPPPGGAPHAGRGHGRGPGHDLRGLGRAGGPRQRHPRGHAPAGPHHRGRGQRDRSGQLPARRLRGRPRPGR